MKTLLLSLVVVAFVCLDSGDTLMCRSCTGTLCLGREQCAESQKLCYEKKFKDDLLGMKTVRGCADTCADPGENEKIMCCAYDNCNW